MSSVRLAAALVAIGLLLPTAPGVGRPRAGLDFGVFCVRGHLQVEQRRIEELKASFGPDVCRLEQDATETGARAKALQLGGSGATCACD
jgi:hypothetical protein